MMQTHGTYIGFIKELQGKTALLHSEGHALPTDQSFVAAQFDQLDLTYMGVNLAHGWHHFPSAAFRVDEPEQDEPEQDDDYYDDHSPFKGMQRRW